MASTPDTAYTSICQSNCCECAESEHAALSSGTKNRVFNIAGEIRVSESVEWAENSSASENSQSREEKNTVCVTNNQNGGLGAGQECITLESCPPTLSSHGGDKGAGMGF